MAVMLVKASVCFGSTPASLEESLLQGLDHLQFDLRNEISPWLILKPTKKQWNCFVCGDLFQW